MTALLDGIRMPELAGFTTHYGVRVCAVGDQPGQVDALIALGHHHRVRALMAFTAHTRQQLGWRLLDGLPTNTPPLAHVRPGWAVLVTVCGRCGGQPDCEQCATVFAGYADDRWRLNYDATALDCDAFPVTIYQP